MNKTNLTINLWAISVILFVSLYVLAIKQEKDAKVIMKANKQAQSELFMLQYEYLSKTGLSAYNKAGSSLSPPKEVIYIKKDEIPAITRQRSENHPVSLEVMGL